MGKSFCVNNLVRSKLVVSELRIYPGHGFKYITKEGKINTFIHKKARRMALRKVKNLKIKWCTASSSANKKAKTADVNKKRRRKAKRVVREIIGLTADEINRRKG